MTMNNQPIRCFEGNTQYQEPFWSWSDAVEGGEPEMELDGFISEWSWFEDDITPKKFKEDLMRFGKGGPIRIRIHSYGGDVVAASMISSIMREYSGFITVQIDGIAASAATVVAVAGNKVVMQDTAYFMIHDPSVVFFMASLNIEQLERLTSSLTAVKEGIVNAYEGKTGLSRARLSKLMTDDTWMDAQKALDLGFVDEVLADPQYEQLFKVPVDNAAIVNCVRNYAHVPAALMQSLLSSNQPAAAISSISKLSEDEKREAQILREKINTILRKESNNA